MIFNIVVMLVTLLNTLEKIRTYSLNSAKNKQDLINIIQYLNGVDNEKIEERKDNINMKADEGDSHEIPDEEKEIKLQQMLWLLKKNFNAEKMHQELMKTPIHSGSRLYFIKNPEVLEEYKNYVRRKKNYENTESNKKDVENILKKLQRRAEADTGSTESENDELDRQNSLEINREVLNKPETAQPDFEQENQNAEHILEDTEKIKKETREDSIEEHKIRAQDGSDNIVRREKIDWDNTKDEINTKNEEKPFKSKKNKHKIDRKERLFDDLSRDSYLPYKPKPRVNYRKPKSEDKNFFSYGRTSIPFIGKKGIYEDK